MKHTLILINVNDDNDEYTIAWYDGDAPCYYTYYRSKDGKAKGRWQELGWFESVEFAITAFQELYRGRDYKKKG